ncbi:MAG: hypothetical protein Q8Q09_04290 [Deltaproteobacteria bacterium]|nr:hypothetical protein [Deltaproteobacteria bacterium]
MNEELTTLKKVLVAAAMLDVDKQTFSAEDLIVCAWKTFPESFGLVGYRDAHPDSNRVLAKLMGTLGLCGRGFLEQTDTKTYRLTTSGRKLVRSLNYVPTPESGVTKPARVDRSTTNASETASREQVTVSATPSARGPAPTSRAAANAKPVVVFEDAVFLARVASSVAGQKFSRGGMITFDDACSFWGIARSTSSSVLKARLEEFDQLLSLAEQHVRKTGAPVKTEGKPDVTLTTVVGLQGLHRMLLQRYQRELDGIRAREG